jgi:hypothetical protein
MMTHPPSKIAIEIANRGGSSDQNLAKLDVSIFTRSEERELFFFVSYPEHAFA